MAVDADKVEAFITRWSPTGGGERSNCHMFLAELCELIEVPGPEPAVEDESQNAYVFERRIPARHSDRRDTFNYIDLYKRGCFVLEAKQSAKRRKQLAELKQLGLDLPEQRVGSGRRGGAQWDTVMRHAREQAEIYAKRLPPAEGWPPFLVIVDIGHVIELYADFSLQGKHYAQFPDRQSYRIYLEDLRDAAVRERLRLVWTDPQVLNPARRTAEVTREIAALLAKLSQSLETRLIRALPEKRRPEQLSLDRSAIAGKVALFLMRCLFTMFAEDVGLLKRDSFTALLKEYKGQADRVHIPLGRLWQDMNAGGFSPELHTDILKFNGGLFKDATTLEITEDDLAWLAIAADRDWKDVEPAIFGTLLERALGHRERHKLGAHYTPRAYVERLVVATVIEPLTADWRNVQAAAAQLVEAGEEKRARDAVRGFHQQLCRTRVLDPACGTGNFLYVAMELMKRLEGEVLETLSDLGETQYLLELDRHTVDPHQFLGLEINPRAVAIAELVLWIGYLQWHFRTRGRTMPAEPVLKNFANIVERDAILKYDRWDVLRDETGRPITRWDGITYKLHPITGEEVPDEEATVELRSYINPRVASWPEADFIVGNPPFIANRNFRRELGDGYVDALSQAYSAVRKPVDLVVYFWFQALKFQNKKNLRRVGLVSTSRLRLAQNNAVFRQALGKFWSIYYAVPDHEWPSSADAAKVRVCMVAVTRGTISRATLLLSPDHDTVRGRVAKAGRGYQTIVLGRIPPDLSDQPDISDCQKLRSNSELCHAGVKPYAKSLLIDQKKRDYLFNNEKEKQERAPIIYNGYDVGQHWRQKYVLDFFECSIEEISEFFPKAYQYLSDYTKPERATERNPKLVREWWLFEANRPTLRRGLTKLPRYIATLENSPQRYFVFVDGGVLPDQKLRVVASDDAFLLGCLSSQFHHAFTIRVGGRAGVANTPVYNTDCFAKFPFPDPPGEIKAGIRDLGERLDAQRKEVLEKHKQLTMTGLYNVLQKVRAGDTLTEAEKDVYDAGLVGVLRQIHDDLDAAVAEAYGWSADLSDEQILERLVALNHERAAEERGGKVRWLRPEFQAPKEAIAEKKAEQLEAELVVAEGAAKKPPLPRALPEQVAAVRAALADADDAISAADLARCFSQGKGAAKRVEEVLRTLTLLGQAEQIDGGYILSD